MTSNYTYDALYQLTQVTQGANTTESYSYDPVGNRLSSLGASSYGYNNSNELTATPNRAYTYDYNGNTLTKTDSNGTTTYAWDFQNRLTSVTLPGTGGTVSFKYDPFGRRTYKSSPGTIQMFFYDGANLVEETDSAGAPIASYVQGAAVDEPLAMSRAATTSYYQADGLGSITSLSNTSGTIVQTYAFDSFGNQTAASGSLNNPFRYTARELDAETNLYFYRARYLDTVTGRFISAETNLYFYRARYLDTVTGRFISEDPYAFLSGPNFFTYVDNSPIEWVDAFGLQKCKKCGVKKGPQYDRPGPIHGPATVLIHAEFLNDSEHSPTCCEVRQYVSWTQSTPPSKYFLPRSDLPPGPFYGDRGPEPEGLTAAGPCMLGRRSGPFSCLTKGNDYKGNSYDGGDTVIQNHKEVIQLKLRVVDICNGEKTVAESNILKVWF